MGLGGIAYQRNELDTAVEHLDEGMRLCRQFVNPDSLANGLATLAWIRRPEATYRPPLEAMDEAERVSDPTVVDLLNPVPAQRARLLLAQGDVAAAARWTEQRGLARRRRAELRPRAGVPGAGPCAARARSARPGAQAPRPAARSAAVAQDRTGSVIEIQALRALALAAVGDESGAVATLAEALTLAHPQGYVRVFVDEGPPMAALLGRLIAHPARSRFPATTSAGSCGRSRTTSRRPRLGRADRPRPTCRAWSRR